MSRQFLWSLVALAVFASAAEVGAAELRGRLWESNGQSIPPGTQVRVTCGGSSSQPVAVKTNGRYSVRGLPAGHGCQFTVIYKDAVSQPVAFNTHKSVVQFNAEVLNYQGKILILPR